MTKKNKIEQQQEKLKLEHQKSIDLSEYLTTLLKRLDEKISRTLLEE